MAYHYNNTILSNVYNYYQTDLSVRSSSRYDAHNRSDLKKVYKSIVNMSKDSPVFLLKDVKAVEEYTIHMKESAISFRNSIASLGGLDESTMFEQRTVYSSDPDVIEAEGINISEDESFSMTVEALATSQETIGSFLPETELSLSPGSYSFDVSTNSNYELQFNIGENDTNRSIQDRLARLINHSNLGLNASVISNQAGKAALTIRSNTTGTTTDGQQPFSITDENTSQQKGIIDYLGIRDTSSLAQNARYTINNEVFESPSNHLLLDGKYSIRLTGVGGTEEAPITIGVKPDYESLKDNIISLAGSYNNFLQAASKYLDQHPRTNLLVGTLKEMSAGYSPIFSKAGITQDSSGVLSVNEEQLSTALGSSEAEETLDSLKNFAQTTLRKATQIQLNPMDYVDKRIVAYRNPHVRHYANPYVTSAYSGMLFNGYM
ncbi:MAG: hypothetical protein ACI4DW_12085 [Lachnospiraceae bacterium]